MLTLASTVAVVMGLAEQPWLAINDSVMGGISEGGVTRTNSGIRFEGRLSLENNGGFSSVRRAVEDDLSGTSGIRLTVRGDGRTYQFRIRQDNRFDGVAWRTEFKTDGTVQTFNLGYGEFEPVFRGRMVADAGGVEPGRIRQFGVLLGDKKPGNFSLEILSIEVLR